MKSSQEIGERDENMEGNIRRNTVSEANQRRSTVRNPFAKKGEFLKEYKNESLYDFSNFEILKLGEELHVIGTGSYGDVYLARNKKDGKYYAIKQMNKQRVLDNGGTREMMLREISIHRRLVHENVVRLYSHHEDEENIYMIMDYVNKGSLFQVIHMNNGLDENKAFKYFIQVVLAVNFLHENNLIHRDVKPENILVDEEDEVKLCDFGWCVEIKAGNRVTFCGTFEYMAPELIKELPYNHAVDIWSLGVLLFELTHGYSPFKLENSEEDYAKVFKNILKNNFKIDDRISENCADLIKKLLTSENEKRMKINEIFSHPWVKSFEKEYKLERIRKYEEEMKKKELFKNKTVEIDDEEINVHVNSMNKSSIIDGTSFMTYDNVSSFIDSKPRNNINTSHYMSANNLPSHRYLNSLVSVNNVNNFEANDQNNTNLEILMNSIKQTGIMDNSKVSPTNKLPNIDDIKFSKSELKHNHRKKKSYSKIDLPFLDKIGDISMINSRIHGAEFMRSNNTSVFSEETLIGNVENVNNNKSGEISFANNIKNDLGRSNSLFDKVLNEIAEKSKPKRRKTKENENIHIYIERSDERLKTDVGVINYKSPIKSELQMDRLSIEIKCEEKMKSTKINKNDKIIPVIIEKGNEELGTPYWKGDLDFSKDKKEVHQIKRHFDFSDKETEHQNFVNYKSENLHKNNYNYSSNSEYNAVLSTETQLDYLTYDNHNSRNQRITNCIEMLERANKTKGKIITMNEIKSEKNESSFWSSLGKVFNPFKCSSDEREEK